MDNSFPFYNRLSRTITYTFVLFGGVTYSSISTAALLNSQFQVQATITSGCMVGNIAGGSGSADFGQINFGTISSLNSDINIVSTQGTGSIFLKCTPGTSVTIAMDAGVNAGIHCNWAGNGEFRGSGCITLSVLSKFRV